MGKQNFQTSLGEIPLWGELSGFSRTRPLLLVIRGAFADFDQFEGLSAVLPHVDVALAHLPGMHTPYLERSSIPAFAQAFDEAVAAAFPGRAVNVLGASMGGLVAMALKGPVRSIVGIDPPLSTATLWPLTELLRRKRTESAALADWIWQIFGVDGKRIENRDYRPLLKELNAPTRILLGSEPLAPERPLAELPSLVSEDDIAAYRANPKVNLRAVADTGHNIPRYGQRAIFNSLLEAMPAPTPPG